MKKEISMGKVSLDGKSFLIIILTGIIIGSVMLMRNTDIADSRKDGSQERMARANIKICNALTQATIIVKKTDNSKRSFHNLIIKSEAVTRLSDSLFLVDRQAFIGRP